MSQFIGKNQTIDQFKFESHRNDFSDHQFPQKKGKHSTKTPMRTTITQFSLTFCFLFKGVEWIKFWRRFIWNWISLLFSTLITTCFCEKIYNQISDPENTSDIFSILLITWLFLDCISNEEFTQKWDGVVQPCFKSFAMFFLAHVNLIWYQNKEWLYIGF